jgi:hypothetical protein
MHFNLWLNAKTNWLCGFCIDVSLADVESSVALYVSAGVLSVVPAKGE